MPLSTGIAICRRLIHSKSVLYRLSVTWRNLKSKDHLNQENTVRFVSQRNLPYKQLSEFLEPPRTVAARKLEYDRPLIPNQTKKDNKQHRSPLSPYSNLLESSVMRLD